MGRSRRQAVQRYHDRVAHQYDDIYTDAYWRWHDALTWDYVKPHLPREQRQPIIDLGCGTGKWGLKIAHSGYRVTCLDISTKMVETVRRKVAALGLDDRVDCVQGDVLDLSALPAEHFALAVAFGEPLCCTEAPERALKQVFRLLKSGGLLLATFDNRYNALDFYLEKNDLQALMECAKTGRTHWLTRDPAEQFALRTYTPRQVGRLLDKAGFEVLEIRGKTVLPLRHYRALLEDRAAFRRLLALEKKLAADPQAAGRAAHLQCVARRPSEEQGVKSI